MYLNKSKKTLIGKGFNSNAYNQNSKFIILEGKNSGSYQNYIKQKNILDLLKNKIKSVEIPQKVKLIKPKKTYPYGALKYKYINGAQLVVKNLTEIQINNITKTLAGFLKELHNINPLSVNTEFILEKKNETDKNIALLKKFLTPNDFKQLLIWQEKFNKFLFNVKQIVLTHGDLWEENLIVNKDNELIGIIDFGSAAYSFLEIDYAIAYNMNEYFYTSLKQNAGCDIDDENALLVMQQQEVCFFEYAITHNYRTPEEQIEKIRETGIFD